MLIILIYIGYYKFAITENFNRGLAKLTLSQDDLEQGAESASMLMDKAKQKCKYQNLYIKGRTKKKYL